MVKSSCMYDISYLLYINAANLSCFSFFASALHSFFKIIIGFLSLYIRNSTIHIYLDLFIHSHDSKNDTPQFHYDGWCSIQQKTKITYNVTLLFYYIYYIVLGLKEHHSLDQIIIKQCCD